jgi:hypothetical protein
VDPGRVGAGAPDFQLRGEPNFPVNLIPHAGIGEIFSGPAIGLFYNPTDSRAPDILITPNIGVTYSNSKKKLAEHGGFAHDDTNVMMLVSNPDFASSTVPIPVETAQVAPTILEALGLNPTKLQAVQQEGTTVLPGINL